MMIFHKKISNKKIWRWYPLENCENLYLYIDDVPHFVIACTEYVKDWQIPEIHYISSHCNCYFNELNFKPLKELKQLIEKHFDKLHFGGLYEKPF